MLTWRVFAETVTIIIAIQLRANAITDNSLWLNVHLLETVHNAEMYVPVKTIGRNIVYVPQQNIGLVNVVCSFVNKH